MPEFSLAALPEVFVSDSSISRSVYEAVERGHCASLARASIPAICKNMRTARSGVIGTISSRPTTRTRSSPTGPRSKANRQKTALSFSSPPGSARQCCQVWPFALALASDRSTAIAPSAA